MACKDDGKEGAHLEGSYVCCQAVAHDGDEFRVDLVLVLLVVPLELVELDEHHRLLLAQVASERLPDVRDERDNNRQRL